MSKYRELKPVLVDWVDPASTGRWRDREDAEQFRAAKCRSAGFLVSKNAKWVVLALSQGDAQVDDVLDTLTIPRGCVTRIRRLYE